MTRVLSRRGFLWAGAGLVPAAAPLGVAATPALRARPGSTAPPLRLGTFEDAALLDGLVAGRAVALVCFPSWHALWDAVTVAAGAPLDAASWADAAAPLDAALLPESLIAAGAACDRARLHVLPAAPLRLRPEAGFLVRAGAAAGTSLTVARALADPVADAALPAALVACGLASTRLDLVTLPAGQCAAHVAAGAVDAALVTGPRLLALARQPPPGTIVLRPASGVPAALHPKLRLALRRVPGSSRHALRRGWRRTLTDP